MELNDFVKNTLIQIVDGIIDAEKELLKKGASANPVGGNFDQSQVTSLPTSLRAAMVSVLDIWKTS